MPCEHFDWRPGRIRNTWASLKYWRLTGQFIWPDARATHNAVRHSPITDVRKARKARKNALARIGWLRHRLDELDN